MEPVTTVGLIVALIGAAEKLTPEVREMISTWIGDTAMSDEELVDLDAALAADRARVAKVYEANGVK